MPTFLELDKGHAIFYNRQHMSVHICQHALHHCRTAQDKAKLALCSADAVSRESPHLEGNANRDDPEMVSSASLDVCCQGYMPMTCLDLKHCAL
jgi:hypothetical protein